MVADIAKLSVGREEYYTRELATDHEAYLSGHGESPGWWYGAGAASLGLEGEASPSGFQAMFEGRHPDTGELLGRPHGRNAVPAFDVVLRPTKSVSILYGLGDAATGRAVLAAHHVGLAEAVATWISTWGHAVAMVVSSMCPDEGCWRSGSISLPGVLAALGAAACFAGSYVYARRLLTNRDTEPLVLSAAQLTVGACLIGVAIPWLGRQPVTLTSTVVLSVVALGVLSTGIAYVLNYRLIQDEGPTAASMTNYLTPVVAVLLGVAVVDEMLSWNLIVGTAMVLLGVWIAERNLGSRGREASEASALLGDDAAQSQERIR